ncbi:hypothetical protein FN846DRAFT_907534 [Sphaerosporella brunnea]|uniref:Hydrophobic surface binding protein A-domain-containing protein n=1 Tax=Sphaerosporella brunnea TaxID=1250544 RepID=A0A5J5EWY9_9PEZI|nr:hypothetical protein FN846DRAFT_907534 [Sphaerosporella brunnea]
MRTAIPATLFLAALTRAAAASSEADQEAKASSIMSKLDALTTVAGYAAFESAAESVASDFYATQTFVKDTNAEPTDAAQASANMELSFAYMSEIEKFAEKQTVITGSLRDSVTSALGAYVSLLSEAAASAALPTDTTATTTGSAESTADVGVKTTAAAKTSLETVTRATTTGSSTTATTTGTKADASSAPASGALGRTVSRVFAGAVAGVVAAAILL